MESYFFGEVLSCPLLSSRQRGSHWRVIKGEVSRCLHRQRQRLDDHCNSVQAQGSGTISMVVEMVPLIGGR